MSKESESGCYGQGFDVGGCHRSKIFSMFSNACNPGFRAPTLWNIVLDKGIFDPKPKVANPKGILRSPYSGLPNPKP